MASSTGSKIAQLIVGAASISALGLSTLATIRSNAGPEAVQRLSVRTGDEYILTTEDSSPVTYLNDEATPIEMPPIAMGTEYCTGMTGAQLCTMQLKLTGSGGHRNSNAGSFTCSTSTCSFIRAIAFTESGSDALYGGWTTTPGSASGAQLFNFYSPAISRGGTITGSASYIYTLGGAPLQAPKDAPPGSTVKFTWARGNGTEHYGRTIASVFLWYFKGYNQ